MRIASALLLLPVVACASPGGAYRDIEATVGARGALSPERRAPEAMDELHPEVATRLREPLDADAAVSIALRQSPALQARLSEVDVAVAELWGAARPANPELEIEALVQDGQSATLELTALVDLADVLRTPLRRRAAEAALDAAELDAAADVLRYAFDTRVAFYRHQADLQLFELYRTATETFLAAWEAAADMQAAGNLRALDVAQQRAAYERSRVDLAQAELRALMSRERLQVQLGLTGAEAAWSLPAVLPATSPGAPTVEGLERVAVERSLVLDARRQELLALARRVGVERMEGILPEAQAGIFAEREEGDWAVGPSVAVEVPLFDQNQGGIGRQRAQLRIRQQRFLQRAIRIRSLARRARAAWLNAAERVRFYDETLLPARAQVLDETLRQYNAMNVGVFQLLQARRMLVDTARERVEALHDYWRARAAVELVVAGGEPPAMDDAGASTGTMPGTNGSGGDGH